jgi:hypothetical protein
MSGKAGMRAILYDNKGQVKMVMARNARLHDAFQAETEALKLIVIMGGAM